MCAMNEETGFLAKDGRLVRILGKKDGNVLFMDIKPLSMPKTAPDAVFGDFKAANAIDTEISSDLTKAQENVMWQRMNMISQILPCLWDKRARNMAIKDAADKYGVSLQKVRYYLKRYLAAQDIRVLAPKEKEERELTEDEKNFRWALNRFYYNRNKHTLVFAYKQMLLHKYCDEEGNLGEYPSFYRFRYFYRKTHDTMNELISREGKTKYERDYRPLITEGVTEYATAPGVFLLDGTVLDIYLVNEDGEVVGRPLMTACIDAYSGLCCGYALSWEGGIYSVVGLMLNVTENKVNYCKKFGIEIEEEDWPCYHLPAEFVTDEGSEYISQTFSQITELGCRITHLPSYRPEMKGAVEQFFDRLQEYYKPQLLGKGVIMPDFQERGAHDYRKDACLTMEQFERVIIRCILFDIRNHLKTYFPYTKEMLSEGIRPTAAGIWDYAFSHGTAMLRKVRKKELLLTLLPRTRAFFCRKGLKVNKLHYFHPDFTEEYLKGGEGVAAYNPDNISQVFLLKEGSYIPFSLIQKRYQDMDYDLTKELERQKKELLQKTKQEELQASLNLMRHIQVIRDESTPAVGNIKNIRQTRKVERERRHKDYYEDAQNADGQGAYGKIN